MFWKVSVAAAFFNTGIAFLLLVLPIAVAAFSRVSCVVGTFSLRSV